MRSELTSHGWWRSLRVRLMAWNALVVIVTAVVTLIGLREGVRITLIRELDQVLVEDLNEIALAASGADAVDWALLREQLDRKDAGHAQHKWFAELLDPAGQAVYQSSHAPNSLPQVLSPDDKPQTIGQWRFVSQRVADRPAMIARVGLSLEMMRGDIARIDRLVGLAAGIILVLAPLCGYWLAGRATKPLDNMIRTMARLKPTQLDDRLPLCSTGDELDRLSSAVNGLLDRIGCYLQERQEFLANAAHELRTPLAAIRNSIEVALSNRRSIQEYEDLLHEVITESTALEVLVNQLLLISETDAERLKEHTHPVRLDQVIEKAIDMFAGVAEYRDIQLICPALPQVLVMGVSQHLRQVVYNLLDNALKFTSTGGRVTLDLREEQGFVVFSVRDTGIGISEANQQRLFDRFFRVQRDALEAAGETASRETRGTGLGLSICHAIVHAHQGSITVTSREHEGSCFTVRLPAAEESVERGQHPGPSSSLQAELDQPSRVSAAS